MSFNSLLTHLITTYRNLPNGVGIQKSYQQNLKKQSCMIQPVSAEFAQKTANVFGRTYFLFVPLGIDIEIGDKLVDSTGKQYSVAGDLKRAYGASAPHTTFTVVEEPRSIPDQ